MQLERRSLKNIRASNFLRFVHVRSHVRALKPRANARNIVGQQDATLLGPTCCERLDSMLRVVATCWKLLDEVCHTTTSKKSQQHATTHNMVCKRSQHVGPNKVVSFSQQCCERLHGA